MRFAWVMAAPLYELSSQGMYFVHKEHSLRSPQSIAIWLRHLFAALTVILTFFKQRPCFSIYFLPTAAKSKQKVPPTSKFSSSND
ncbi:hypothetical protein L0668_14700 [Paraglaciecola aquimarina]|uniref:Uncharacterized protein n=1 Tax=Paraglaciecola algarum TaxID=3050085 RepID=A0ABS9D8T4_9ALTE|nr:hypothetical protein [Paraglaciecola sp. G1-23]MCF2949366.1 hypothetical protein [Paraglaciecola sp. G1-23]